MMFISFQHKLSGYNFPFDYNLKKLTSDKNLRVKSYLVDAKFLEKRQIGG